MAHLHSENMSADSRHPLATILLPHTVLKRTRTKCCGAQGESRGVGWTELRGDGLGARGGVLAKMLGRCNDDSVLVSGAGRDTLMARKKCRGRNGGISKRCRDLEVRGPAQTGRLCCSGRETTEARETKGRQPVAGAIAHEAEATAAGDCETVTRLQGPLPAHKTSSDAVRHRGGYAVTKVLFLGNTGWLHIIGLGLPA